MHDSRHSSRVVGKEHLPACRSTPCRLSYEPLYEACCLRRGTSESMVAQALAATALALVAVLVLVALVLVALVASHKALAMKSPQVGELPP